MPGHSGRLKAHLAISLLGFYLVNDRILKQKSIRMNTVCRERTMAAYVKWTEKGGMGSKSIYDERLNLMLAPRMAKRKPGD